MESMLVTMPLGRWAEVTNVAALVFLMPSEALEVDGELSCVDRHVRFSDREGAIYARYSIG